MRHDVKLVAHGETNVAGVVVRWATKKNTFISQAGIKEKKNEYKVDYNIPLKKKFDFF